MSKYWNDPRRPLTQRELEAIIEDIEAGNDPIDIAYIPPDVDELSDEEVHDDEDLGEINTLSHDLAGTYEIMNGELQAEEEDKSLEENRNVLESAPDERNLSNPNQKKVDARNLKWGKTPIDYEDNTSPQSAEEQETKKLKERLYGKTPGELFSLFFDREVMETIINYSVQYSLQKNRHGFHLDVTDLEKFLGILILSGYHILPQQQMYWSADDDKGVPIVKEAMSRNRFLNIKQNLHLSDNNELNTADKFSKIRPICDMLNKNFCQFGIFRHNLSIDEQMVPYYGRHSSKMFIKGKPVRFGFKIWCLASSDGYLFQFLLYGGKESRPITKQFGLGGDVVLELLKLVENKDHHKIYFDNFFSSYALLVHLKHLGFFATGTIRDNRLLNCPLETSKSMSKKYRGYYSGRYDYENDISVIRWNDNSIVTVISNCDAFEPLVPVKRYSRKDKKEITVSQPNAIHKYNCFMGGVDLHDNAVANYRINIRGKKWWWPLFINLIDGAVVNAWKLHRLIYDEKPRSQIDFRSELARCLLQKNKSGKSLYYRGRASKIPLSEVRLDNVGHLIEKNHENWRRRCKVCKSQTVFMCTKCRVPLHSGCFASYHQQ